MVCTTSRSSCADAAGNTTTTAALTVTIDTTIATLNAPDLTTATDTAGPGGNTSDNLTKDNTPDFSINVSTATAGDTVELLNNGSSFGAPVTHVLTQGEITAGSITLTAGTLGDGLHNISVKLSDAAGNTTTYGGAAGDDRHHDCDAGDARSAARL